MRLIRQASHPSVRRPHRLRTVLTLVATALLAAGGLAAGPVEAAPRVPAEFDFARYQPVNPDRFRALSYLDHGNHYFRVGTRVCMVSGPSSVGCSGGAATAPRGVRGVAISGDMQGPQWVPPRTTYRFTPRGGFRPPVLGVGTRVKIWSVTCAVPRAGVVTCSTPNRAFGLSRAWHRFYYPKGDRAHSKNPKAKYLPAHLR